MKISSLHKQLFGESRIATLGQILATLSAFSQDETAYVYCLRNPEDSLAYGRLYENGVSLAQAVRDEYFREERRALAGFKVPRGFYVSDVFREEVGGNVLVPFVRIEYRGRFESLRGLVYEVAWIPGTERKPLPDIPKGYRYPWWLKEQ